MKSTILVIIALLVIGGATFFVMNNDDNPTTNSTTQTENSGHNEKSTDQKADNSEVTSDTVKTKAVSIDIKDSSYSITTLTIKKGTAVTWTNKDSIDHDVTADNPSDNFPGTTGLLSMGQTYSHTFSTTGIYTYHCTPHASFMKGTVIVTD